MTPPEKTMEIACRNCCCSFEDKSKANCRHYNNVWQMHEWDKQQFAKEKEKTVINCCDKITEQAKDDYKQLKKQKKRFIEWATEWLRNNTCKYMGYNSFGEPAFNDEDFYTDFQKNAEEQL